MFFRKIDPNKILVNHKYDHTNYVYMCVYIYIINNVFQPSSNFTITKKSTVDQKIKVF